MGFGITPKPAGRELPSPPSSPAPLTAHCHPNPRTLLTLSHHRPPQRSRQWPAEGQAAPACQAGKLSSLDCCSLGRVAGVLLSELGVPTAGNPGPHGALGPILRARARTKPRCPHPPPQEGRDMHLWGAGVPSLCGSWFVPHFPRLQGCWGPREHQSRRWSPQPTCPGGSGVMRVRPPSLGLGAATRALREPPRGCRWAWEGQGPTRRKGETQAGRGRWDGQQPGELTPTWEGRRADKDP